MDTITAVRVVKRREYSAQFKSQVVAECDAPGASVAKVALAHGINSNIVHGWRKLAREPARSPAVEPTRFVPVSIAPAPCAAEQRNVEFELRRGALSIKISWPAAAALDLAAFTRELLR